ncbi:MAG: nuclear transport factor 2 family protein [Mycobacteriaceae bacterium]|nr:nuclear transport factor 2 family protein [Mycobacteriaceae bacterium]
MTSAYGRPTAAELVDAVAEFLDVDVRGATGGQVNFHARVAANVLRIVERELETERPSTPERGSSERPSTPEQDLISAIRGGDFDDRDDDVISALRSLVYHRLEVAHPGYASASVADRLFAAIEAGDVGAVAALWSDDVRVWHAGDERASDKARALRVIDWFVSVTRDRHYEVADRRFFDGGFVQQHRLHGQSRDGSPYSIRVGIIIRVGNDGLITRVDEYFDPADLVPLLDQTR